MTPADLRLSALAALFARERSPALLARWAEAHAPETAERTRELAAASRRARLVALSAALASGRSRAGLFAEIRSTHPRIADALRASPRSQLPTALMRLVRERLGETVR